MSELRELLYEMVGRRLLDAAWRVDFPINPMIGTDGFLQAFRDTGLSAVWDQERKTASFMLLWKGETRTTILTQDELLRGWKRHPPSCPRTFYDSIFTVLDRMESDAKLTARDEYSTFRNNMGGKLRKRMEAYWLPSFATHHEHMLLPIPHTNVLQVGELTAPVIFDEVFARHPVALHERALKMHLAGTTPLCGPCAEYIDETPSHAYTASYHPSESSFTQYFWGYYLERLSAVKGYRIRYDHATSQKQRATSLIKRGVDGFEEGEVGYRDHTSNPRDTPLQLVV